METHSSVWDWGGEVAEEGRRPWRKLTAAQFGGEGVWQTAFAGGGRRGFYRDIFNLLLPLALSKLSFFLNILCTVACASR